MAHLYCANPNLTPQALGFFNPRAATAIERVAPTMPLRGKRYDVGVTAGTMPAFAGAPRGLGSLGDWFSDAITSVGSSVTGIVDGLTGRGAARDQAQAAQAVAEAQAAARIAEARASSDLWGQALPAIGIAAAAAIGLGLIVVLKR